MNFCSRPLCDKMFQCIDQSFGTFSSSRALMSHSCDVLLKAVFNKIDLWLVFNSSAIVFVPLL